MAIWGVLIIFPLVFFICSRNNIIPENFNFLNDYIVLIISILFTCTYLCDSCKTDFKTGGTLFLINMKVPVYAAAVIKILMVLIFSGCIVFLDFCFLPDIFVDWTWYLILLVFVSLAFLSFVVSVLLCGADTISFLILIFVSAVLLLLMKQSIHILVKILFPIALVLLSLVVIPVLYKRKWFRINIK